MNKPWTYILLLVLAVMFGCERSTPGFERDRELRQAMRALEAGQVDEALKRIDAAIALDQGAAHLHQVRGSILFHARRFDEAVVAFDHAFGLNDRSAEAALGAGLSLAMLGEEEQALDRYRAAERLYSFRADNPPDAEQFSQHAIDQAVIDARLHLALIAALRGEQTAALGQIDRLARSYPQWEEAEAWRQIVRTGALEHMVRQGF